MYQTHFGLKQGLFENGIAMEAAVFRGAKHDLVTAYFKVALTSPEAVVTLSGPAGVGKTTLVASALRAMSTRLALVWLSGSPANASELLELLLVECGLNAHRATRVERLQMWRQFLNETNATDSRLFVIVERTEDLAPDVLRALDSLTAADPNGSPGANLVLLGQQGLDQFLAAPALDSLRQRIRVRQKLEPFGLDDLTAYLRHAVSRADGDFDRLFAPGTVAAVHRYTGGVARVVNNLCETALSLAATKGLPQLTPELVTKIATSLLGLAATPTPAPGAAISPATLGAPPAAPTAAAPAALPPMAAPTIGTATAAPPTMAPPAMAAPIMAAPTMTAPTTASPAAVAVTSAAASSPARAAPAPIQAPPPQAVSPPEASPAAEASAPVRPSTPAPSLTPSAPRSATAPSRPAQPAPAATPAAKTAPVASPRAPQSPAPLPASAPATLDYDGSPTDTTDAEALDFPLLTDAVDTPEPEPMPPLPAGRPAAAIPKSPPAAPVAAERKAERPEPKPAPERVETAYARRAAASAPPPAEPEPEAPTLDAEIDVEEESALDRTTSHLRALSTAKSLDDISNSMAETLFGDAELDMLSAALASAGWSDEAEDEPAAEAPPEEPQAKTEFGEGVDESFDLFDLGADTRLELVDDASGKPRVPTRKVVSRR